LKCGSFTHSIRGAARLLSRLAASATKASTYPAAGQHACSAASLDDGTGIVVLRGSR
jgi:hypothetical protein